MAASEMGEWICKRCGTPLELCKDCPGGAFWVCPKCVKQSAQ